jgi:CDP-diacylglycerol--serine O-phosphatidyltransferase
MSAIAEFYMSQHTHQHFQMLRSFTLGDVFTFANASCGTLSIFLCMHYLTTGQRCAIGLVFVLLPLALLFDVVDGRVARWQKRSSTLGADLDSLADSISFGVAPAVLGFALGLRGGWDVLILTCFVACGISRLARYNVTAETLTTTSGKVAYFEGVPIPANVIIVLFLAMAFAQNAIGEVIWWGAYTLGPWLLHPLALLYAVSGSAMISRTLRIPKP